MKKNDDVGLFYWKSRIKKMLLLMKLMCFWILVGLMQVHATTYGQAENVSFEQKKLTIDQVFNTITVQLKYDIFYSDDAIDVKRTVELSELNLTVEETLRQILGNKYEYKFVGKTIVVLPKATIAQQKKAIRVVGVVTDEQKKALPGVTVVVKGLAIGTATDVNGKYALTLPEIEKLSLLFSFVGMKTQEVKYVGKDTINVVMEEDLTAMEEVVVTGYQTFKKHEMVGAVERVKGDDLFTNGNQSLEQMLQGRIAGMAIVNPSGMVGTRQKVRVRGTSSILGNQEPIWVVDGMIQEDPLPFKTSEFSTLGQVSNENMDMIRDFVGGAISWLNPSDIEDITVLKDAAATVMYGVKAANGVIVITTKKGKAGRMSVSFNARVSVTPRVDYKDLELMNSKERVDVSREIIENGLIDNADLADIGYEGAYKNYIFNKISWDEFNNQVDRLETVNTDWFDILFCDPMSQNYSVGISGGSERFTYRTSLGATLTRGTAKGNDKTGYNGSINISTWLHPTKVRLNARLSGNYAKTDAFYKVDPYSYAYSMNRAIPCFNEDGSLYYYAGKKGTPFKYNVLHEIANTGNSNTSTSFNGSFSLIWDIVRGLKLTSTFGCGVSNVNGETYATEESYYITKDVRGYEFGAYKPSDIEYQMSKLPHGGELNKANDRNLNYTWRNQIDYNLLLGEDHRFNFMFSNEIRSSQYNGYSNTIYGYLPGRGKSVMMPPTMVNDGYGKMSGNNIYNKYKNIITDRKSNTLGFLFNASYSYKERYVINLSARTDASNKFGENKKSRRLPVWSSGFRWNMAEETWMKSISLFNELSFRVSYGWQGNVAENFGPNLIAQIPGTGIDNLTGEYLLAIKSLAYPDLRWEKTQSLNLGFDMGFLKNRLMASVNYYYKKTTDLISQQQIPYEFGMLSMPVNEGDMENSGYELTITAVPVRTKDFVWNLSFNTANNKNKIKSKVSTDYSWRTATQGGLLKEGYAYSSFWAFEMDGLDSQGFPNYVFPDIKDAALLEDCSNWMKYAGKREADFTGGLNTSIRYKTLTLSASFNLSIGNHKFLAKIFEEGGGGVPNAYYNLPKELVNRWREPGDEATTNIPRLPYKDIKGFYLPNEEWGVYHTLYSYTMGRVVNASFLRCNNLNLSYTLPVDLVKQMRLKQCSLNLGISNPFIIVSKDFKGKDPEVATGSQPISQTYTLGISISL